MGTGTPFTPVPPYMSLGRCIIFRGPKAVINKKATLQETLHLLDTTRVKVVKNGSGCVQNGPVVKMGSQREPKTRQGGKGRVKIGERKGKEGETVTKNGLAVHLSLGKWYLVHPFRERVD